MEPQDCTRFTQIEYEMEKFDPKLNLPAKPGTYVVCLKKGSKLPEDVKSIQPCIRELLYSKMKENKIIYAGKSKSSLRKRILCQHLGDNARRSTLRKSLGVLCGYTKIPPNTNKYKFKPKQEEALTGWMEDSLIFYYRVVKNPSSCENKLIKKYNPPLNINENRNKENLEFREKLKELRRNC